MTTGMRIQPFNVILKILRTLTQKKWLYPWGFEDRKADFCKFLLLFQELGNWIFFKSKYDTQENKCKGLFSDDGFQLYNDCHIM